MALSNYALAPLRATALLTGAKSFVDNPIIGSERLNRLGLHVARIRFAERMADMRRRRLAAAIDPADAEVMARDGFVTRRNALPDAEFAALLREIERPMPAREIRQGAAVTRFIDLSPGRLAELRPWRALSGAACFSGSCATPRPSAASRSPISTP